MEVVAPLIGNLIEKHAGKLLEYGLSKGVGFLTKELGKHKKSIVRFPANEVVQPEIKKQLAAHLKKKKSKTGKKKVRVQGPQTHSSYLKAKHKGIEKVQKLVNAATHGKVKFRSTEPKKKARIIKFSVNENGSAVKTDGPAIVEGSANRVPLLSGPESSIANESNIIDKIAVKQLHPKDPFTSQAVDGIVIHGVEYLGRITTPATTVLGQTLFTLLFNPSTWNGSRLQRYANLYEKYFFRKVEIIYEPIVSKMTPGQLAGAIYHNAAREAPPASELGLKQLMTQKDAIMHPVYQVQCMTHSFVTPSCPYYIQPDASYNDSIQGNMINQAKLIIKDASGLAANTTYGSLAIKYEVSFYDSSLQNTINNINFQSTGSFYTDASKVLFLSFTGCPINTSGVYRYFVLVPANNLIFDVGPNDVLYAGETYYGRQLVASGLFMGIYRTYDAMLMNDMIIATNASIPSTPFSPIVNGFQIGITGLLNFSQEKINKFLTEFDANEKSDDCSNEEEEEEEDDSEEASQTSNDSSDNLLAG